MALRNREISLSYFHKIPRSMKSNPQQNKTSSYHSPLEVAKFLRIPQQDFTSSTRHFPYNKVYFSKWKFINTLKHEDLHSVSSAVVGDLFSPIQPTVQLIRSHMHTSHPYIINTDNTNACIIISLCMHFIHHGISY